MFQSTHPRRVWPSYKIVVVRPFLFQSTHPRRVWLRHITDTVSHHEFQSTHPRRVWLSTAKVSILLSEFQSTHPRRVWPERPITDTPNCWFQSTHPRRVWQRLHPPVVPEDGFNPHTHAGCDPTKLSNGANEIVSIHTPTQGVTIGGLDQQIKSKVSIHTPTQGVTRIIWISIYLICFNPHTHAGCDRRTCNIGNSKAAVSIHTPTQGVTIVEWFTGVFDMFQSTHPRRVWQAHPC